MTVGEQMQEALNNDHGLLAHALFSGLQKGYWQTGDPADGIDFSQLDAEEVEKMTEENLLSIEANKLYSVPIGSGKFAMFFAPDEDQAKKLYKREFKSSCTKAYLVDHGMDISTYDLESKIHQTWREVRNSLPELPAYAGIFQKN